jgi:GDP-4-dehydro-6-deoxy-D-mannose reductase
VTGDRDLAGATVAVTGANGFVGAHVARLASRRGARDIAVAREMEPSERVAIWADEFISADLTAGWPVTERLDAVIHLAGLSAVGPSFGDPQRYISVNSQITTHLCEALLARASDARIVVVSSGSVYASPQDAQPITESGETSPGSPYAVAKILVETQARYYGARGLRTVVARPFNHIGPGQGAGFLVPDIVAQLRATSVSEAMAVGNLDTARDYTDVRDVASAYLAMAFAPVLVHSLYNVATGRSHTGREILHVAAEALGRPVPALHVDPSRLRPHDVADIRGDASLLRSELGWRPTIDWRSSINDYVAASA